MKLVIKLIAIAALTGCTQTTINRKADGSWTMQRASYLQKLEIPGATIATNGTWTLRGYSSDGGATATENIIKAAAEGAAKGAR